MLAKRDHTNQQRAILALSFEPTANGYLYYHWRWSRGIPVTPEEREAYLSIPVLGSRRNWRKAIADRSTAPSRAFRPVERKLLASMPNSMVVMALVIGIPLTLSGLTELQSIGGAACVVSGGLAVVFGVQIVFAKVM